MVAILLIGSAQFGSLFDKSINKLRASSNFPLFISFTPFVIKVLLFSFEPDVSQYSQIFSSYFFAVDTSLAFFKLINKLSISAPLAFENTKEAKKNNKK